MSTILWLIMILVAGAIAYAATRPNTFRLQRSTLIAAEPERISHLIEDFHEWRRWSPWEKLDPNLKRTYSGPDRGVGATYEWDGNGKAGSGRMKIAEQSPSTMLVDLDLLQPFKASNKAEFTLTPTAGGTNVNWAMFGPQPFLMRLMGIFLSPEKMVGPQFEEGLANLKREAERKSLN